MRTKGVIRSMYPRLGSVAPEGRAAQPAKCRLIDQQGSDALLLRESELHAQLDSGTEPSQHTDLLEYDWLEEMSLSLQHSQWIQRRNGSFSPHDHGGYRNPRHEPVLLDIVS